MSKIERQKDTIKDKIPILNASSSFFGIIVAISYFPLIVDPKIDTKAKNTAKVPKSSGV